MIINVNVGQGSHETSTLDFELSFSRPNLDLSIPAKDRKILFENLFESGLVRLNPKKKWAVELFHFVGREHNGRRNLLDGEVQYEDVANQLPIQRGLVLNQTQLTTSNQNLMPVNRSVFSNVVLTHNNTKNLNFTPLAYGFRPPENSNRNDFPKRMAIRLFMISALLLLLAIIFYLCAKYYKKPLFVP